MFPLEGKVSGEKWHRYAKGGEFQKWYGNMWLVVNYENSGSEIKDYVVKKYPYLKGNPSYVVKNEKYYLREGVTYSASGSKGPSFRHLEEGSIFDVYDLTEHDKAIVLAKEGACIGGLPVTSEARDAYLADTEATKEFPLDAICEFIEALPTKEFSAEERETIEIGFPTLYQSNNDLEEFCIRHQVNPINVWYWFKYSDVIPKQRMHTLAMEFLADMIREILMEDEDGIIPLVPNAGDKLLVNRQSDLADNDSAEAQNEKDRIGRQLREIEEFKAKIDDLLSDGYDPVLDDGVGKNIASLQKRKMIPYEVLTPGQLKKYLNADW